MKTITINEKEIELPESWAEINFKKFEAFSKLVKRQKTEKELKEEYQEEKMDEDIMNLTISLDNMNFNTKIACFWSGLSEEELSLLSIDEVESIIKSVDFVNESYLPISLDKFTFKDETYYLPEPGMMKQNFGTYIEAEQIELNNKNLEIGNLAVLPRQLAILCKKKDEKPGLIDDDVVDKREELFKELDMATIWDVGFFLHKQESILMNAFLTSLKNQEEMEEPESQQKEL